MKSVLDKRRLSASDAADLYGVPTWNGGYFQIGAGGLMEVVTGERERVPLPDIIAELRERGVSLPLILRFPQILENRLERLNRAFAEAREKFGYESHYQGVFPIKVNQRRVVVETLAEAGARFRTGVEAGSKAELALCLVQDIHPEALLCCNGFKDDDFIRLALWGRRLGKNVVITLEKFTELARVLRISEEMGIRPALGLRYKLHAQGSGQWEDSGGDRAKFGLSTSEMLSVTQSLRERGMLDTLVMVHCHVGSQVTDIRKIRTAVREAAQTYVELRELGVEIRYLNVGGGLAVDYDGSKTSFYASANYGLQEYADTVVYTVLETCQQASVPHPVLVSESGRALTAHHALLVLPVIDVVGPTKTAVTLPPLEGEPHTLVADMRELLETLSVKNYREVFYDAASNKDTMHSLFDLGYLSITERAHVEELYNRILAKIARIIRDLDYVPDDFEDLPKLLADKYICNFSLFQSLPDHWAIGALFPIVPLSRLDEPPTRDATLVDITCDSDGKIEKFIDLRDVKATLRLHEVRKGEPYYLGVFLMGAYQDVLANAHNLFGRVNEAHVRVSEDGFTVERIVNGQKARRVIENMGYEAPQLRAWLFEEAEEARAEGRLSAEEAEALVATYNAELVGYTYLEDI
ncbi:biosynthetic arginine decarboxylase [Truepera radiovictrix]|uniref:Biosynthetic arginine decarboxylase n=1 Tax=Truepera radiovictrix (strain DSM 17093 / CIP 108686 / LMG 22925 / RQ-24) TaxID=649638 RepID=D7CX99_TRURR|nr:arginine decarboxylase [Truepera radiovictrix DSM 17093]